MKHVLSVSLASCIWLLVSPTAQAIVDVNDNGLSDLWERAHNNGDLFPNNFDPQTDPDGDGWSNAQEAAAGTDPSDANPPTGYLQPEITFYPAVYSTDPETLQSPAAVTLNWPTLPGKQYTLHYSTDLAPGNWSPLDEPRIGTGWEMGSGITLTQPDGSIAERIFCRVAVTDPVPAIDTDSDGLGDYEEYLAGTDSVITDSDGDTLSDYAELMAGTNPNQADEDGDGITDPLELAAGTDSKNQDTDGDAIPDWLDTQPLLNAQVFADADDDGIPDANDPDPNNPRGPKPLIISDNASGNPNCELEMDESSSFILTVSNPAGPVPTSSDFKLYLNGEEETANITALTTPPSAPGTQRFNFSWLAKVTTSYPTQTLQNISLRFRDSQNATTWLNLARIDVAEWEGYIAMAPVRQAATDENGTGLEIESHINGRRHADSFGNSGSICERYYRGPRSIAVRDEASHGTIATFQIPPGVKSPLFITRFAPTGISNTSTIDAGNFASFPHNSAWFFNNTAFPVRYNWEGIVTDVAANSTGFQNYGTAWGAADIAIDWQAQPTVALARSTWRHEGFFEGSFARQVHSVFPVECSSTPGAIGPTLLSKLPASITPHRAGTLEYPGAPIHPLAIEKEGALFLVTSETYHQILYKVDPAAGEWTAGIKLHLGRISGDDTTPQAGIGLYDSTSGGPTQVPLDAAGNILLSPTENSILYQKLTSSAGLPLFLKRSPAADQPHTLEIRLVSKYEAGKMTTVAAVNVQMVDVEQQDYNTAIGIRFCRWLDAFQGVTFDNEFADKDRDRFRIRIPAIIPRLTKINIKATDLHGAMIGGAWVGKTTDGDYELEMKQENGAMVSTWILLVSDGDDDVVYNGKGKDNDRDDQTLLADFESKILVTFPEFGNVQAEFHAQKAVGVITLDAVYLSPSGALPPDKMDTITRHVGKMKEVYRQIGIRVDASPTRGEAAPQLWFDAVPATGEAANILNQSECTAVRNQIRSHQVGDKEIRVGYVDATLFPDATTNMAARGFTQLGTDGIVVSIESVDAAGVHGVTAHEVGHTLGLGHETSQKHFLMTDKLMTWDNNKRDSKRFKEEDFNIIKIKDAFYAPLP